MAVRRVGAHEWEALRDLRLRALADAPAAFRTTSAEARHRPEEYWRDWAVRASAGPEMVVVVDDAFAGLAGGARTEPDVVMLFSMWVAPEHRASGLADELVRGVLDWARTVPVPRVVLEVVEANVRALAFYRRCGFEPTGRRGELRGAPNLELARGV